MPEKRDSIARLLDLAVPKDNKGSAVSALIVSAIVAIIIGIFSFQAVRAKRKAAKLSYDIRKMEQDKLRVTLEGVRAQSEKEKTDRRKKAEKFSVKIAANKAALEKIDEAHQAFVRKLDTLSDWDDIVIK